MNKNNNLDGVSVYGLSENIKHVSFVSQGDFKYFGNPDSIEAGALAFATNLEWYKRALSNSNVTSIITTSELMKSVEGVADKGIGVSSSPRDAYWEAFSNMQAKGALTPGMDFDIGENSLIHPTASVSDKVKIGRNVRIGPYAVIGDYSQLGDDCEIHEGCVVGCEGMQLYRSAGGKAALVRHAGGVRLGNSVSMLARSMVSKAVHPVFTQIGDETCLSLMVSVGHQSVVGKNCSIAGNCLLGGSVRMGDNVIVGPSATIKDSVFIGDGARIRMGSVVISNVLANQDVSGNFALSHAKNLKDYVKRTHG